MAGEQVLRTESGGTRCRKGPGKHSDNVGDSAQRHTRFVYEQYSRNLTSPPRATTCAATRQVAGPAVSNIGAQRADAYPDEMTGVVQVLTVAATEQAAQSLLQGAVRARLAAGGRVSGPSVSAFWHEGVFGTGEEWVALLITTSVRYPELEAHLRAEHEWDNPEVTAVAVEAGSAPYLDWVRRSCTPFGDGGESQDR